MDEVRRILAVSRSTRQCIRVVRSGISLARKYGADLCVVRVVYDPFNAAGWNLPMPSFAQEYKEIMKDAQAELDEVLSHEKTQGLAVKEFVRDGKPVEEILRLIRDEKIDLMLLLAHDQGRVEHFLFGRTNEELCRRMPCSIFLLKSEPFPDGP
jgi:nucleotide-binding universal stress UspA family protein